MGYYKAINGTKSYEPDNSPDTLYIQTGGSYNMAEFLAKIQEHFGDIDMAYLKISAENINTRCIGYDCYDSSDYDTFIVIERE